MAHSEKRSPTCSTRPGNVWAVEMTPDRPRRDNRQRRRCRRSRSAIQADGGCRISTFYLCRWGVVGGEERPFLRVTPRQLFFEKSSKS